MTLIDPTDDSAQALAKILDRRDQAEHRRQRMHDLAAELAAEKAAADRRAPDFMRGQEAYLAAIALANAQEELAGLVVRHGDAIDGEWPRGDGDDGQEAFDRATRRAAHRDPLPSWSVLKAVKVARSAILGLERLGFLAHDLGQGLRDALEALVSNPDAEALWKAEMMFVALSAAAGLGSLTGRVVSKVSEVRAIEVSATQRAPLAVTPRGPVLVREIDGGQVEVDGHPIEHAPKGVKVALRRTRAFGEALFQLARGEHPKLGPREASKLGVALKDSGVQGVTPVSAGGILSLRGEDGSALVVVEGRNPA